MQKLLDFLAENTPVIFAAIVVLLFVWIVIDATFSTEPPQPKHVIRIPVIQ